jgi:hypothetical protein
MLPYSAPISGSPSSQEVPAWSGESTQSDRVDIAGNIGKIALKLLGGAAAFLILGQVLRGTSYDGFPRGVFYVGAIVLGALAIRSLPRRAPALSLFGRDFHPARSLRNSPSVVGGDHRFGDEIIRG